ncbi:hypothetical protein [Streptomyces sp. P17]|nr:hypothetical protein [Streptomyces sp. P17]MDT9698818.1 hypothetical protein [Streptomyces sp. P17]
MTLAIDVVKDENDQSEVSCDGERVGDPPHGGRARAKGLQIINKPS